VALLRGIQYIKACCPTDLKLGPVGSKIAMNHCRSITKVHNDSSYSTPTLVTITKVTNKETKITFSHNQNMTGCHKGDINKCIGDDTKAAARQSPDCI